MSDQRDVGQDGKASEEGRSDTDAPTPSSGLDIESEQDEGDLTRNEDLDEEGLEGDSLDDGSLDDDAESGAGYGNNNGIAPNPD